MPADVDSVNDRQRCQTTHQTGQTVQVRNAAGVNEFHPFLGVLLNNGKSEC
ncbi:hypothetical protein SDC9_59964 [bioreactor metagenome]|uniref:Uncharacterized protein n=1 Tax=bioreactor metagenome TaxID=1076179 RepID=A0A644XBL6_9ZZZZ